MPGAPTLGSQGGSEPGLPREGVDGWTSLRTAPAGVNWESFGLVSFPNSHVRHSELLTLILGGTLRVYRACVFCKAPPHHYLLLT